MTRPPSTETHLPTRRQLLGAGTLWLAAPARLALAGPSARGDGSASADSGGGANAKGSGSASAPWLRLPPLRVVIDAQAEPLSFVGEDGQARGFALDLLRGLTAPAGLAVRSLVAMPLHDALSAFRSHAADMLLSAVRTEDRARHALFTRPYQSLSTVIVSRLLGRHVQMLEECRGQRLAITADHELLPHLQMRFSDVTLLRLGSHAEVLQAVARQRAEAGVVPSELVARLLHDEYAGQLAITGLVAQAHAEVGFMLQPELTLARDALDAALASVPDEWLMAARERWFGLPRGARGVPLGGSVGRQELLPLATPVLLLAGGAGVGSVAWIARLKREIQRRGEVERQLVASRDEAALSAAHRKRFITFLSHEARTLVATMVGGLDLATHDIAPALRHNINDGLRANAAGLKQLLDESLDAAAIDAGAVQVHARILNVGCVMRQVCQEAAMLAAAKHLSLHADLPGAAGLRVLADPVRLAQALRNLVFNALKFTVSGGVQISAALRHVEGKARVVIEVADSGPGLSAAQIEQLFQPFAQLSAQDASGGSGLGLAISRELVQRMQGSLAVCSTPGHGSTFTIELPAAPGASTAACAAGQTSRLAIA